MKLPGLKVSEEINTTEEFPWSKASFLAISIRLYSGLPERQRKIPSPARDCGYEC
jgi:hypothetical protein